MAAGLAVIEDEFIDHSFLVLMLELLGHELSLGDDLFSLYKSLADDPGNDDNGDDPEANFQ